ncbi:hypothetical protein GJ496_009826 [Pomphorhynchus laevis]|nr:hypothetical protein GJ496_009826 [Pomphorhynchus laevis]
MMRLGDQLEEFFHNYINDNLTRPKYFKGYDDDIEVIGCDEIHQLMKDKDILNASYNHSELENDICKVLMQILKQDQLQIGLNAPL